MEQKQPIKTKTEVISVPSKKGLSLSTIFQYLFDILLLVSISILLFSMLHLTTPSSDSSKTAVANSQLAFTQLAQMNDMMSKELSLIIVQRNENQLLREKIEQYQQQLQGVRSASK